MHKIISKVFLIVLLYGFFSCTRESDNGAIDGFWQLQEIRVTEENEKVTHIYPKDIYWAFQLELAQINYIGRVYRSTFSLEKDFLCFNLLYYSTFGSDAPLAKDKLEELQMIGVTTASPKYKVLSLNAKVLILQNRNRELYFRKY